MSIFETKDGPINRIINYQGEKVEFTGTSEKLYGGLFYQAKYLTGHKKGTFIDISDSFLQDYCCGSNLKEF